MPTDSARAALSRPSPEAAPIPFAEFVALVAALMALGALGIDTMLPALPEIGQRFGVPDIADRTLVITAFVVGFGIGQPIQGPLTDRFGRKPVLAIGMAGYVAMSLLAGLASSFPMLLAARFIGGVVVASGRVVTVAMVRDCFSGRAMAKVTSLAFMVFMASPVIAPSLGQIILLAGSWRLIFEAIGGASALVLVWYLWRMPETLAREDRRALSIGQVLDGWRQTVSDRASLGYAVAAMILQGGLFAYITSIQPIMADVFHRADLLGPVFAIAASMMAMANLLNARIVMQVGMRRISQAAMVVMVGAAGVGLVIADHGGETLPVFVALQALTLASYGLASSNMSAMAMENMGAIAGTASSLQGFLVITGGSLLGTLVATLFDGTTMPLHAAFLIAGVLSLGIAGLVEHGRLFRPA